MSLIRFTRSYSTTTTATTTTTTTPSTVIKHQFIHRQTKPKLTSSNDIQFLPPAKFTLSIISLSYNRPNVHALLSQSWPASRSIRHIDPNQLFILTAIPARFVNQNQPIPNHIHTLSSCFSKQDQERWKERRIEKQKSKAKPTHQLRLTFSLRIKELHKSAVIRKSIRKRWIAALKLIVQYGASSSRSTECTSAAAAADPKKNSAERRRTEEEEVRIDPAQAGFHRWLDPDHYYIVHPTLALNTVGLPQLIRAIREALLAIHPISNNPRHSRDTPSSTHPSRKPFLGTTHVASSPQSQSGSSSRTNNQHAPPTQSNPFIIKPQTHSLISESPSRRLPSKHPQFMCPQHSQSSPASLNKPRNTSTGSRSDHPPPFSPPRRRLPTSDPKFVSPQPTRSGPPASVHMKPSAPTSVIGTTPEDHSLKSSLEPPRKILPSRPIFTPPKQNLPTTLYKPRISSTGPGSHHHSSFEPPPRKIPSSQPKFIPPQQNHATTPTSLHMPSQISSTGSGSHHRSSFEPPPRKIPSSQPKFIPPQQNHVTTPTSLHMPSRVSSTGPGSHHRSSFEPPPRKIPSSQPKFFIPPPLSHSTATTTHQPSSLSPPRRLPIPLKK
ncbi:uncharacterized protein PGTG_13339 [Puccinia graminis f. sp. tritici CRL 75-36-700-3]|uniref:Uncharacterized protein n=1 Tax=Puccinia graminis f. sp. tritici (strain CRL 75-36-700-3 / race SCCL) TaxID=418459 RepID=E3KS45_PUCGT|nr:uncharacterized protein PGTG_13339 [Puccinia graminis f. sp. tritici CRL 75-36-700-3]EFP87120.2 hypothetical protein PGTG_13339 [Puccinia graminis f. sp. tritici CRL 75-36-700-3]